jgi:hypothetical protein
MSVTLSGCWQHFDMTDAKPDLELELAQADWILQRVKTDAVYAQNLYAAMCNNDWQKNTTWPVLCGDIWHVSWRGAGRIVSELRGQGNYLDWYCTGISPTYSAELEAGHVAEGEITEQILADLADLGWVPVNTTSGTWA